MRIQQGPISLPVNGALSPYLRYKLSGGVLALASNVEDEVGTLCERTLAGDTVGTVLPREESCVRLMVASVAITQFAIVYAATNGRVAATGTLIRGIALEAASGDGAVIRVLTNMASLVGTLARGNITQEDLAPYPVDLVTAMRVHDARQTNLPGTASADDMGLITGTPGTDAPTLQGVDFGGTSTDEKAGFTFVLPPEYVAGETVTVRVRAAMLTAVSDGTATVDVECWKEDGDGAVGADICATAAQSINSLTPANKDFTITPTTLNPGDKLQIRLAFAGSDSGNLAVMIPEISNVALLLDIKG